MNIEETMIAVDGRTGPIAAMTRTVGNMGASARRGICLLDARLRTLSAEPEEGATTAEYAVVSVADDGHSIRVTAQCPVLPDPFGVLPVKVTGSATGWR